MKHLRVANPDQRVLAFAAYAQPLIESYEQMSADDEKDHPGT